MKKILLISLISAIITILFCFLFPKFLAASYLIDCQDSSFDPTHQLCSNTNSLGWQLSMEFGAFGAWGIPFLLGIIIFLTNRKSFYTNTKKMFLIFWGLAVYIIVLGFAEMIYYKSWETMITPAGETYSRYSLNSIYFNWGFLIILGLGILGFLLTMFIFLFRQAFKVKR